MVASKRVVVTGGTGFIGSLLIKSLISRGHQVIAIVRQVSLSHVPAGATAVVANVFDPEAVSKFIHPQDTFVHLIGTPHPNPFKARQFENIDFKSVQAAAAAATKSMAGHFVYLSVAQPAPTMKKYIQIRMEGEKLIRHTGLTATFFRPWYVIGPGRKWPIIIAPVYWLLRRIPRLRESALRLSFVSISEMVKAMVYAIENPPAAGSIDVVEVPKIKNLADKL